MNSNSLRHYRKLLLSKPEAIEDYPFNLDVAVYKIRGKMFATLSQRDGVNNMNLKCAPDQALMLRKIYASVVPGWHMNKKHWNTLLLDGSIPPKEIRYMIDHSYEMVVKGMKKADRDSLSGI